MKAHNNRINELQKEIDFLYLYPPASMTVIKRKEEQLSEYESTK